MTGPGVSPRGQHAARACRGGPCGRPRTERSPALAAREEKLQQLWVPMLYSEDEAGRVQPEGKITAIEVEALVFNILRTDRPREVETRSYTSTYNPLNWVIELP